VYIVYIYIIHVYDFCVVSTLQIEVDIHNIQPHTACVCIDKGTDGCLNDIMLHAGYLKNKIITYIGCDMHG